MKFPLVSRARLEAEAAKGQARLSVLTGKLDREKARAAEREERMSALKGELQEARRIAEVRATELEDRATLIELCESRLAELERLQRQLEEARTAIEPLRQQVEFQRFLMANAEEAQVKLLDRLAAVSPSGPGENRALPLMYGIDVEPDGREVDRAAPDWRGTVEFFKKLPELRDRLSRIAGQPVVFNWFVRADPQVEIAHGHAGWALQEFAADWKAALAAGDEIGLHMHPWRWDDARSRWVQDHADAEWMTHCLRMALETYQNHFGHPAGSYRGGDHFFNDAVARQLEEAGVRVDYSLEQLPESERLVPYELGTGVIPDMSRVPHHAYRPSTADFRIPDPAKREGLGLMPLTSYAGGILYPWLKPELFERGLDLLLRDTSGLSHLALVGRTSLAAAPSWEPLVANAETLARRAAEGKLEFTTATKAWDQAREWLDARSHQSV